MFGSLGAPELLIILAIVVVLFGATRIGDIGKGIGRGIREFRREIKDGEEGEEEQEKKPEDETVVASTSAPKEGPGEDTNPPSPSPKTPNHRGTRRRNPPAFFISPVTTRPRRAR